MKRLIKTLCWLTAGALALTAVIVTAPACTSQPEPPTREPRPTSAQEAPTPDTTKEALIRQLETLLEAQATIAAAPPAARPLPTPPGSPQRTPPPDAATSTPPPTGTPIPPPSGPGICSRTPEVQQRILNTLKINSCRVVTTDELYRITQLSGSSSFKLPLTPGDLHGLVNLKELTITNPDQEKEYTLQPGVLAGASVGFLKISGVNIAPGAFDNATGIKSLTISRHRGFPPVNTPSLSTLTALSLDFPEKAHIPNLPADGLQHLDSLTHLHIEGNLDPVPPPLVTPTPQSAVRRITIPFELLAHTPKLTHFTLATTNSRAYDNEPDVISIATTLFSRLQHLESIYIQRSNYRTTLRITGRSPSDEPFRLHPSSPLSQYLTPPDIPLDEWASSTRKNTITRWLNWNPDDNTFSFSVPDQE